MERPSVTARLAAPRRPLGARSAALAAVVLTAGLALAGCTADDPSAAGTRSPSASPSSTASGGATPSMTPAPPTASAPPAPTTPPEEVAWTAETAFAACIAFHGQAYGPGSATWDPYSPGAVRQEGGAWLVDLSGTVDGGDGAAVQGYFSCTVSGTPAAPQVSELAGL